MDRVNLEPWDPLAPYDAIAQSILACGVALVRPITDDPDIRDALDAGVKTFF